MTSNRQILFVIFLSEYYFRTHRPTLPVCCTVRRRQDVHVDHDTVLLTFPPPCECGTAKFQLQAATCASSRS